jgi:hypothetical protein
LEVKVTDEYDVPPRERIKVKEYHLSAKKSKPVEPRVEFITVITVGRDGQERPKIKLAGPLTPCRFEVVVSRNGKQLQVSGWPTDDDEAGFIVNPDMSSPTRESHIRPGGEVRPTWKK